ncbi:MAG: rhamnogalacturonidase [Acidobacteriaceae bacterium]
MKNIDSVRRDLLRMGGFGLAAASVPTFGMAAERGGMAPSGQYLFDVRKYGATGDGKTVDSPAINKAIEAAAAAGGGTVVFPAGTYMSFSIRLKSRVHLYLGEGAVILAAASPLPGEATGYRGGTYDAAEANPAAGHYEDYGHRHWHNSLIWADGEHDMSITGPGLIYGKGLSNGTHEGRGGYPGYVAEQAGVGNKAIAMKNCHNVIFRDFSILKGGHFGMLLTGVDNLTIDNVTIDTDRDGMDVDCCKNVRLTNLTVNSPWDDGICLKSSYALGFVKTTEDVTISSSFVTGDFMLGSVIDGTWKRQPLGAHVFHAGRIKCGTESNGGFINITITNCIFDGCMGYALESEDGALLEDITISNSTMRNLYCGPIFMRLGARLRGPKATTHVGTMRRVLISNLDCYGARSKWASTLSGIPGHNIEDVKFSNVYIDMRGGEEQTIPEPAEKIAGYPEPTMFGTSPAYGFFIRHLKNLEMSHVELALDKPDARPAFYMDDVQRADFFAITAPKSKAGVFSLHKVKDFRIGWSRAAEDKNLMDADNVTL